VNRTQLHAVPAVIRQAGPGDQDAIREFLDGLSVQTRYLRFFAGFSPTSPAMLRIRPRPALGCPGRLMLRLRSRLSHIHHRLQA